MRKENKNTKDPLMLELIKLKEKIERTRLEEDKNTGKINYIKAIIRYEDQLDEGLFEITVT